MRAGGEPVFRNLTNPNETTADRPAGSVSADVVLTGTDTVVLGPTDLNLREGTSTIVYAIGSAEDETLDIVAQKAACQAQPPGDTGADRAAALGSAAPSLPVPPSSPVPGVPVQRGALPTAGDAVAPRRLRVPALGLDATVTPVGIDAATGDFAVPPSVDRAGWYRWGPGLEADAGSVVIAGHVDSAEQGRGAFFRLCELDEGDRVTGADGAERAYRVVARQTFDKRRVPLDRFFARDGAPRLTLITCGGPFDPGTGHYRDNVVVTAEPA